MSITITAFTNSIETISTGRYIIDKLELPINNELDNSSILNTAILKVKRVNTDNGFKTIVVTVAEKFDENDYKLILEYTALIKEQLIDPETADLYLVVLFNEMNITLEQCINLEASELLCRKYILRPNENHEDLLHRTFFHTLSTERDNEIITDPLLAALKKTAESNTWLSLENQLNWQTAFLSKDSGYDLIHKLFESKIPLD